MGTKKTMYTMLKVSNDIKALNKGTVKKRVKRRILGKIFGRLMRGL